MCINLELMLKLMSGARQIFFEAIIFQENDLEIQRKVKYFIWTGIKFWFRDENLKENVRLSRFCQFVYLFWSGKNQDLKWKVITNIRGIFREQSRFFLLTVFKQSFLIGIYEKSYLLNFFNKIDLNPLIIGF